MIVIMVEEVQDGFIQISTCSVCLMTMIYELTMHILEQNITIMINQTYLLEKV